MKNQIDYKLLPRVEVSFQDHFNGTVNEVTTTVKYVLDKLSSLNIKPKIGDKILLLEKDADQNNQNYYIGNIGEIIELNRDVLEKYSFSPIPDNTLIKLDNIFVMIKIDKDNFFDYYN